ncbi:MAG: 2-oxoacid:acceptor oxidoreductase subunit alpha [Alphaproteobacteria bacterium]|nr:2-oxoacid:acceptor oxidoreductase subunit alpha [Alphaproteobacteria bacterium]
MKPLESVNEFVVRFANINGTGSWSANLLFAKAIFRMGIPISPKNIFPSNIQGLPTWYEVRISEKGYIGTRGGCTDIMVSVNAQSIKQDVKNVLPGGYFIYDNTKPLNSAMVRNDITYIGLPLTNICSREYADPKLRLLFKNIIYVGALAALVDMDFEILKSLVSNQFEGKEKLIESNIHALELGYEYTRKNFKCPIGLRLKSSDKTGDSILIDCNTAMGLGAIYGGATVVGWYPITPSTTVIDVFKKYAESMRTDPITGRKNFAVIQAEDELSSIGIVLGAAWNGARSFTATSGPGISLMSEFLGFGYFAEIPAVLLNVQRIGPSTGMPTRTQQSDVTLCAYASHGDTKHILLFPSTPKEAFDFTADAFDLAERLQTPVIIMSDLDLGMNESMSDPLTWDDNRKYDRGKVLTADELKKMKDRYGRYMDVDGDGICYRTYPGTHPLKGSFITRGTSHNIYAGYTENSEAYVESMERLLKKWETAKRYMPIPEIVHKKNECKHGVIYYGSTMHPAREALDRLTKEGHTLNSMRIRAFPFTKEVEDFITEHDEIFVIEQNRDAQMRSLLINECEIDPKKMVKILVYSGTPITSCEIHDRIHRYLMDKKRSPLKTKYGD